MGSGGVYNVQNSNGGGSAGGGQDYNYPNYDYNSYDDYQDYGEGRTSQGYLQGYDYGDRPYPGYETSRGSSDDYSDFQAYDPVNYYSNLHSRGEDAYVGGNDGGGGYTDGGNGYNGYRNDDYSEDFYYKK